MKKIQIENNALENSLVVVSAKEHGKIYQILDGEIKLVEYVEEHPPSYSDNEGFFFRSAGGQRLGSGAPKEVDDRRNIERYIKGITEELSTTIKTLQPKQIFLFEPEHLKGLIAEHVIKPNNLEIILVKYGNYVEADLADVVEMLTQSPEDVVSPADPASVAGEENAEEKRKILEVGQLRDGM